MSEILKSIWGKLYAWALPSAIMLAAVWFVLLPQLGEPFNFIQDFTDDQQKILFLCITGALSISLSSISTQLYRILEGYLWPRPLQDWGRKRQQARKRALKAMADAGDGWRRGIARENLARYPLDDREIVPTRFGNAIRAFETYGQTRFSLDSQTLWFELVAVAPKSILVEIREARSSVDFFVASYYLSGLFGLLCFGFGALDRFSGLLLIIGISSFGVALLCHWLAIRAVDAWSYPIHALVNLGRVKLADSLALKLPNTLEKEKEMWSLVVRYAYLANADYGKALDEFRKTPSEFEFQKTIVAESAADDEHDANDEATK